MEPTMKQLEDRLRDLGMMLDSPPSDIDKLLHLLDETEIYLSRVEQSPSASMSDALSTIMNSLITKEFLNHSNMDAKVFVATCFNEILRIKAPDAPYDDNLMKEIFTLIVDAFGDLGDISGFSYSKRVSILEIMAKVRSCLVMLDLECDELILRMFEHFMENIRPDHPANVFFSMETIMTLILEESEVISPKLLICLLSNDETSKKLAKPTAGRLAEKVISNCAMNLKPYLFSFKSKEASFDDYSGIIASLCQKSSNTLDENEKSQKLDKFASGLEVSDTVVDRLNKVQSNGDIPLEDGNSTGQQISPALNRDNSFSSDQGRNVAVLGGENYTLASEKLDNKRNLQHEEVNSSSLQLIDGSDSSHKDKEATQSLKSDSTSDMVPDTEELLKPETEAELKSLEGSSNDTYVNLEAPSCSPSSNDLFTAHKSANPLEKNEMCGNFASEDEGSCFVNILEDKVMQDSCNALTGDSVAGISDGNALVKEQNESNINFSDANNVKEVIISQPLVSCESIDVEKHELKLGVKLKKKRRIKEAADSSKIPCKANDDENHKQKMGISFNKKRRKSKLISSSKNFMEVDDENNRLMLGVPMKEKHQNNEEEIALSKHLCEPNDENNQEKAGVISKKKRLLKSTFGLYKIDMEIVGRKIEVWWPNDERFYEGVIESYDPMTKKHKILYDDGDVEILFLKDERWNYTDSKNFQLGLQNDTASPNYLLQIPFKKARSSGNCKSFSDRDRGIKAEDPSKKNIPCEPPQEASRIAPSEELNMKRKHISPSGRKSSEEINMKRKHISPSGGKSARSRRKGKTSTSAGTMKNIENNGEIKSKSHRTERFLDDAFKNGTSESNFEAKFDAQFIENDMKFDLKPTARSKKSEKLAKKTRLNNHRALDSKISITLDQKRTPNAPGTKDGGIKIVSSKTNRVETPKIRTLEEIPNLKFSDIPAFNYVSKSKQERKDGKKKKQKLASNDADVNAV